LDLVDVNISNVYDVSVITERPYSSISLVYSCILPLLFSMVLFEQKTSINPVLITQVLSGSSFASFWNLRKTGLLTLPLLQAHGRWY